VGALRHVRRIGARVAFRRLHEEVWSTRRFFGLRCDLTEPLPEPRPAKIEITMEPAESLVFRGFDDELARSSPENYLKVLLRTWYCRAGVEQLYVAWSDGVPVYAQWLLTPAGQQRIPSYLPGRFPPLRENEMLLEGAYTFEQFRGLGVMAVGMGQLVRIAKESGAAALITYVDFDNVPSLRGCANVGFVPDIERVSIRRAGLRRTRSYPYGAAGQAAWNSAVGR
jgi:GNAT superfamily N-acetyltransferase